MRLSEEQQARIREIEETARAEGREPTPQESREMFDVVMSCIGENVTDRVSVLRRPGQPDALLIDGEEAGRVEWF